jgi:fumarate reductase subunit C
MSSESLISKNSLEYNDRTLTSIWVKLLAFYNIIKLLEYTMLFTHLFSTKLELVYKISSNNIMSNTLYSVSINLFHLMIHHI